jgi:hypothetical protein
MTLNEQMKNHGYSVNYEVVVNLAQAMPTGRGLEVFFSERHAKSLNWQSTLLTSIADGEIPLRGSASTREEIVSWESSILRNSV